MLDVADAELTVVVVVLVVVVVDAGVFDVFGGDEICI